jgi:hypothetical protein
VHDRFAPKETSHYLGMTASTFTLVHVWLSVLVSAPASSWCSASSPGNRSAAGRRSFLITTAATSVTGFAFPFDHLLPSHKVGIVSLAVSPSRCSLATASVSPGPWRRVYAVCAGLPSYLNVFVAVVQAFERGIVPERDGPTQ